VRIAPSARSLRHSEQLGELAIWLGRQLENRRRAAVVEHVALVFEQRAPETAIDAATERGSRPLPRRT
jgi:hypothetical protein